MINWFAVHTTSINGSNTLVCLSKNTILCDHLPVFSDCFHSQVDGDNKGIASQLFESFKNPGQLPGKVQLFLDYSCKFTTRGYELADCDDCKYIGAVRISKPSFFLLVSFLSKGLGLWSKHKSGETRALKLINIRLTRLHELRPATAHFF